MLVDVKSRLVLTRYVPDTTERTLSDAIAKSFVQVQRVPSKITTDRQSALTSENFRKFARKEGLLIEYAPAHSHANNGLAERLMTYQIYQEKG